jgi:hypothetical protein
MPTPFSLRGAGQRLVDGRGALRIAACLATLVDDISEGTIDAA